jgi:voltage-gated potassium channel
MFSQTDPKRVSVLSEALGPFKRRFAWAAAYFGVIVLIGMVGYRLIEQWDWFSALYMSVTTVSSVGFMEVEPLSTAGRAFTIVLLGFAVTGLGIWWGLITALIVELDLAGLLRRRRIMSQISELKDHFIVCGGGRMGRVVIDELYTARKPFVLVERDPAQGAGIQALYPDVLLINDDATKEHTLTMAGVERASGLAACLTEDGDNLMLCLTARGMCPHLTIVARAAFQESLDKLRRAGADHVMSPIVTGGLRIASMLLRPSVVSYLDVATTGADEMALRLEETSIPATSSLVGHSLAEAKIPQRTGLIVMALHHGGRAGPATHNPGPETILRSGDVLIVLGRQDQIQRLREYVERGQP